MIRRVHVAAANDRRDTSPRESLGMFEERGDAKGSRGLDDEAGVLIGAYRP